MAKKKGTADPKSGGVSADQREALVTNMCNLVERKPELEPVLLSLARVGDLYEVESRIMQLRKYRQRVGASKSV